MSGSDDMNWPDDEAFESRIAAAAPRPVAHEREQVLYACGFAAGRRQGQRATALWTSAATAMVVCGLFVGWETWLRPIRVSHIAATTAGNHAENIREESPERSERPPSNNARIAISRSPGTLTAIAHVEALMARDDRPGPFADVSHPTDADRDSEDRTWRSGAVPRELL